jgi:hypothetical protein
MARPRKRSRRQLGLGPEAHGIHADSWLEVAMQTRQRADQRLNQDPCGMIEQYTDAIAGGTVAEVQFEQAGYRAGNRTEIASDFVSATTRKQREAVRLCRRMK